MSFPFPRSPGGPANAHEANFHPSAVDAAFEVAQLPTGAYAIVNRVPIKHVAGKAPLYTFPTRADAERILNGLKAARGAPQKPSGGWHGKPSTQLQAPSPVFTGAPVTSGAAAADPPLAAHLAECLAGILCGFGSSGGVVDNALNQMLATLAQPHQPQPQPAAPATAPAPPRTLWQLHIPKQQQQTQQAAHHHDAPARAQQRKKELHNALQPLHAVHLQQQQQREAQHRPPQFSAALQQAGPREQLISRPRMLLPRAGDAAVPAGQKRGFVLPQRAHAQHAQHTQHAQPLQPLQRLSAIGLLHATAKRSSKAPRRAKAARAVKQALADLGVVPRHRRKAFEPVRNL